MKTAIQSDIKEISTDIATNIPNNFIISFNEFRDFRQHQVEHVLV